MEQFALTQQSTFFTKAKEFALNNALVIFIVTGAALFGMVIYLSNGAAKPKIQASTKTPSGTAAASNLHSPVSQIAVDVSGAVIKPGVYQLASGSRVQDALTK